MLSNYQEDFFDFFVPGEDFDFFDGTEDLLTKIEYYLSHEKERKDIAENGFAKSPNNTLTCTGYAPCSKPQDFKTPIFLIKDRFYD